MALDNGHNDPLGEAMTRPAWGRAQLENVRQSPRQGRLGLLAEQVTGLTPPRPDQAHNYAQRPAPARGAMDGFIKTCQRWRLTPGQQVTLLGYAGNEFLGVQLLSGQLLLPSQDVKDRIGYVVGISVGLGTIFDESVEAELAWLNTPHAKLKGMTPLAHMLGGRMSALMVVAGLVAEAREL